MVDAALEDFDTPGAGRAISSFVDDLSNWYVRLSRTRFWQGDPAALATLHETIEVLTRLLAPFVPFTTEAVHDALVTDADSVHLRSWPLADEALVDTSRAAQVALGLAQLGWAAA